MKSMYDHLLLFTLTSTNLGFLNFGNHKLPEILTKGGKMEDARAVKHKSQLLSSAFHTGRKEGKLSGLERSLGTVANILQLGVTLT